MSVTVMPPGGGKTTNWHSPRFFVADRSDAATILILVSRYCTGRIFLLYWLFQHLLSLNGHGNVVRSGALVTPVFYISPYCLVV